MTGIKIVGFVVSMHHAFLVYSQGLILSDLRSAGKPLIANNDGTISGSPYLVDSWNTGIVYAGDKIKSGYVLIRYNVYSDAVEMQDGKDVFTLDPGRIKGFRFTVITGLDTLEFHFRNGFSGIKSASVAAYFAVLFEGKNIFLKRYIKKLGYDPSSYGSSANRSFQDQTSFYVIRPSGEVTLFMENRKSILKAFPEKEKQISAFIKKNSIRVASNKDMRILSMFIDDIL